MTIGDLIFLLSALFTLVMAVRISISAITRRWQAAARTGKILGIFLALYGAVLIGAALTLPRRFYAPNERRCFDDWCAAAVSATVAGNPCGPGTAGRDWIAIVEISSDARRIRQRAADAHADLEDEQGRRYRPCASSADGKSLSDPLEPGESLRVSLPFHLPADASPAGIVLHHGDFPGAVIIGSDQSFLHSPALQRVSAVRHP